jgi:hypothetical protein
VPDLGTRANFTWGVHVSALMDEDVIAVRHALVGGLTLGGLDAVPKGYATSASSRA